MTNGNPEPGDPNASVKDHLNRTDTTISQTNPNTGEHDTYEKTYVTEIPIEPKRSQ